MKTSAATQSSSNLGKGSGRVDMGKGPLAGGNKPEMGLVAKAAGGGVDSGSGVKPGGKGASKRSAASEKGA